MTVVQEGDARKLRDCCSAEVSFTHTGASVAGALPADSVELSLHFGEN